MGVINTGRLPHLIISLLFPVLLLMTGCIDENIFRVSEDVEITPSYSLPIGPLSYDINDYLEGLDTVSFPWSDSLYYNDTLYPSYRSYLTRFDINLYDFNSLSNDFDRVEGVMFRLIVSNGYPTRTITQVYFADENQTYLDSAFSAGPHDLQPAAINDSGIVTAPNQEIVDVTMSPYFIQNMGSIRHIIIESIIYTIRPDIEHVKFYTPYAFHVNIAVRIQLRLNTGDFNTVVIREYKTSCKTATGPQNKSADLRFLSLIPLSCGCFASAKQYPVLYAFHSSGKFPQSCGTAGLQAVYRASRYFIHTRQHCKQRIYTEPVAGKATRQQLQD
jgi:hypothetical protein